jgi:hypothetical protein
VEVDVVDVDGEVELLKLSSELCLLDLRTEWGRVYLADEFDCVGHC